MSQLPAVNSRYGAPMGLMKIEPAIFINTENCQGHLTQHWQSSATTSDNKIIIGIGSTAAMAENNCLDLLREAETIANKSPREQLQLLLQKTYLLSSDQEKAIRLISKILDDIKITVTY